MHRRCLRSALARGTQNPLSDCLQGLGRVSFTTSSPTCAPASSSSSPSSPSSSTERPNSGSRRDSSKRDAANSWGSNSGAKPREYNRSGVDSESSNAGKNYKRLENRKPRENGPPGSKGFPRSPLKTFEKPMDRKVRPPVNGEHLPTPIQMESESAKRALMRQAAKMAVDDSQSVSGELSQEMDMEVDDEVSMEFSPGTFVETRKNENCVQGIVLAEIVEGRKWTVISLNSHGEVFGHGRADVHFAVPNFISADLAQRCGMLFVTNEQSQINARVEALKRLRTMTVQAAANMGSHLGARSWERQRSMDVYETLRSKDPTRWSKTTLTDVTNLIFTQPTFNDFYTTHKYLMDNPLQFVAGNNYLKTQLLFVRPLRDIEEIHTVQRLITGYRDDTSLDGPFKRFLNKALVVLQEYDKKADRRDRGPMSSEPGNFTWDSDDQIFLNFLLRSTQPHRSNQSDPYTMGRNSIIKLLAPLGPKVTDHTTHTIIVKLGIIAPWQDLFTITPMFNPTGDFNLQSPLDKEDEPIVKRTLASKAVAGSVLGPEDLHPTDPLESVRHDFGGLKVYVIDEASAEELDDGFSLERIPSEPSNHWLHIHVADPACVLHPKHILSLKARDRATTYYFGHKSFPLFPKSLMHHPSLGLSLGDRSSNELPDRTLTFSVKVDDKANILDYKIRAGLVRNVRKATYNDVNLGLDIPSAPKLYPFGDPEEPVVYGSPLTEDETADLRIIKKLADDQVKKRYDIGAVSSSSECSRMLWMTKPENIQSPCMSGAVFHGFPELKYSVSRSEWDDSGAHSIISEMMKLACRVASRVGTDNNLPLMRRAMDPVLFMSDESLQEILKARTPGGYIQMFESLRHFTINPPSYVTLAPKGHFSLGVPEGEGYTRATSPLRRFEDLVAHWQIHHLLLGPNAPPRPPFDQGEMEKYINEVATNERNARKLHNSQNNFYALMYIKRFMEDTARGVERPNGDPLKSIRCFNTIALRRNFVENSYHTLVHIPELGLLGHLEDLTPAFRDVPISTELRVKIKAVELGIKRPRLVVNLDDEA